MYVLVAKRLRYADKLSLRQHMQRSIKNQLYYQVSGNENS